MHAAARGVALVRSGKYGWTQGNGSAGAQAIFVGVVDLVENAIPMAAQRELARAGSHLLAQVGIVRERDDVLAELGVGCADETSNAVSGDILRSTARHHDSGNPRVKRFQNDIS